MVHFDRILNRSSHIFINPCLLQNITTANSVHLQFPFIMDLSLRIHLNTAVLGFQDVEQPSVVNYFRFYFLAPVILSLNVLEH